MSATAATHHDTPSPACASPIARMQAVARLVLILFAPSLYAQTPQLHFEHVTLAGDLTDYRAFDVAQDSIGFLWFATSEGLYRYDGLTTTAYKPRLGDTSGISSMTAWCLLTDRSGKVWLGTFDSGLECLDPATGVVTHFTHDPDDHSPISKGPIAAIVEDRAGTIWIGTALEGLISLDPSRRRFTRFRHDPDNPHSLSNNIVKALCVDQKGQLWVGTADGLNVLQPGKDEFRILRHDSRDDATIPGNYITSLCCDRAGSVWAGTKSTGMCSVDGESWRARRYRGTGVGARSVFCDSVTSLMQDNRDHLWIGTVAGLYRFDPTSGRTQQYKHDPFNSSSLSGDYVRMIRGDRTGTVWIAVDCLPGSGTQTRCINKLDPKSEQFAYFRLERRGGGSLPIVALLHEEGSNTTWIGSEGLRAFHQPSGKVIEYVHNDANPTSLSDEDVSSLYQDRSGVLWVGTWNGGLNRFDPSRSAFTRYQWPTKQGELGGTVSGICEAAPAEYPSDAGDRVLWIGTFSEGVILFSERRGVLRRHSHLPEDPGSLGSDRVMSMLVDRKGVLWVGTDGGGLNRWDRSANRFVHYLGDPRNPHALRSSLVYSILEDDRSYAAGGAVLWVGTATGLDRFDAGRGTAERMILRDSSEAISVVGILQHHDQLWISTKIDGLFDLPLGGGTTRAYGVRNGLPSNAFLRARWITKEGRIFLGTDEGFITFHPDSIVENPHPPRVVLTAFRVFDEPYRSPQPIWTVPAIHLTYDQNFFSFRFAALDYTNPLSNTFAYRLEGFEQEWNRAGTRNFAGYTGVDPGDYVFLVKAANSDGVWNESGVSVSVRIDPPYWRTWWFQSLVVALVLGMAAGAYRYRVSKLLEMERMRVRIASDLHDDIGSSLSGIALVTESLKSRQGLGERDRQHLADVSHTARRTADALRDIVWLVNPQHDTVDDLFLRMKDAAAMVLAGLQYTITTSGEAPQRTMSLEFRHNLILIYKEVLNNIAKHANAHHATISIHQGEDTVAIRIEDDGDGFNTAAEHRGNGLANLRRRTDAIGGQLLLNSEPGKGTVVTLTAPVGSPQSRPRRHR